MLKTRLSCRKYAYYILYRIYGGGYFLGICVLEFITQIFNSTSDNRIYDPFHFIPSAQMGVVGWSDLAGCVSVFINLIIIYLVFRLL